MHLLPRLKTPYPNFSVRGPTNESWILLNDLTGQWNGATAFVAKRFEPPGGQVAHRKAFVQVTYGDLDLSSRVFFYKTNGAWRSGAAQRISLRHRKKIKTYMEVEKERATIGFSRSRSQMLAWKSDMGLDNGGRTRTISPGERSKSKASHQEANEDRLQGFRNHWDLRRQVTPNLWLWPILIKHRQFTLRHKKIVLPSPWRFHTRISSKEPVARNWSMSVPVDRRMHSMGFWLALNVL